MDKQFSWDYSSMSDILNIHAVGKKTEGGSELGDFTIDFDKSGNVVGVEVLNASEFFYEAGVSKEQLGEIKDAQLTLVNKGAYLFVWLTLYLPNNIEKKIVLPTPIVSGRARIEAIV